MAVNEFDDERDVLFQHTKQVQTIKNDIIKKIRKNGITRDVIKSRSGIGYQMVKPG